MRGTLKRIITAILERRALTALRSSHPLVIFIIGSSNRSVFKNEIADVIAKTGASVRSSLPGYNYRLGAALTVLGQRAGSGSILSWAERLFSLKSREALSQYLILEYALADADDFKVIGKYNPSYIVVSDGGLSSISAIEYGALLEKLVNNFSTQAEILVPYELGLERACSYGRDAGATLALTDHRLKLEGQDFDFVLNGVSRKGNSLGLSELYAYAGMIANYVLEKE